MNKLLTVFNFEFKQYLKKKSTIVMFIIYFVIAFGGTFVPSLFGENGTFKNVFSGEDNSNFQRSAYIIKDMEVDKSYLKEAKQYTDREQIEKDIKEDKIDEAIILTKDSYEYLTKSGLYVGESDFNMIFDNILKKSYYESQGLDYFKIKELEITSPKAKLVTVGGSGDLEAVAVKTGVVYFLAFILYILVFMFGTITANNVAREKTNRAMELLIVTVKPSILIVGKVLAFAVIGILQVAVLIVTFLVGLKINFENYSESFKMIVKNVDYNLIFVWFIFAITGFVMMLFLFSACAALVSRIEELNTVLTLPIMTFMVAFFANIYTMGKAGDSVLVDFLAYFPLTSYFSMVSKYAVVNIPISQVVLSYLILLATTVLIAYISITVYRRATLRYGQKLSFFKMLKNK